MTQREIKQLSMKDLQKLINSSNDLKLLERLEDEYVDRMIDDDLKDSYDDDEDMQPV